MSFIAGLYAGIAGTSLLMLGAICLFEALERWGKR